ncbi:transcription initiation factor TFIID, subunit TAF5 [Polychaeton citri CBS 116435]|uniref:Transcription initiation factor TFIID, subunit TAF5 n=1 Tax=Polychaeton citri CBS 116435 TaxID=1314669 RepID=A0A9P4USU0_9PEZI|nr:transcription initiation factor TFIID, subunit TAF5 [Polychaeton citri CBS 116435]
MSAQPMPPSRTASVGPPSAGGMNNPSQPPPPAAGAQGQQQSQQNLNQIVLEYLSKKGYSRTESTLRKESQHTDADGRPIVTRAEETGGRQYDIGFSKLTNFADNCLDIYKSELKRILWPIFVYSFLQLISDFYPRDGNEFLQKFRKRFEPEHQDDIRQLQTLTLPEHVQQNDLAQLYRGNRYRLTMSTLSYSSLVQFLEANSHDYGTVLMNIIVQFMDIRTVNRDPIGAERAFQKQLDRAKNDTAEVPGEDEGIPGHHPGSANLERNAPTVLSKLSLGPLPMEAELMEDVKSELQEHDNTNPPGPGQNSLIDEFEQNIKREPMDDVPSRDNIPYPPSTARDVVMEVQKVKENRDRFKIESRTGGVGPGVSVTMFTFHNTFDSVSCIEFSGDNSYAAIGTNESYIRVFSLENKPLKSPIDPPTYQPSSSRRLVGHSAPVYALSFSPSIAIAPENSYNNTVESHPRYLLSCSGDGTIRLWSLDTWTNLVVYRGHNAPVWDVRFSPHGHYFASCSADRTARLWSTPNITPLRLFVGHDGDPEAVAWHPNGAYVFTGAGGLDRTIRMWSLQTGSAVRLFTGHVGSVTALSCAPSGKVVASADDRGEILLWDLPTGRLAKRMRGHGRGGIWSLDWSVESTVLVSGGADGTVRVWDVEPNRDGGGKVIGEGGTGNKVDGSGTANGTTSTAAGSVGATTSASGANNTATGAASGAKGKGKKDVVVSPDQISAFPTKKSPVYEVRFTQMNLVVAGGAYLP